MSGALTKDLAGAVPATAAPAVSAAAGGGGELRRLLWQFRREFVWAGVFSLFANVLLLTPTIYMLQVYDRVLVSGSQLTLLAVSLVALLFFLVMGFAEWVRSRLLVRASARFDEALQSRVFNASFEARLGGDAKTSNQAFSDLTGLRQFLTGNAAFAVFDTPWSPVYIVVLFLMHPALGWLATAFMVLTLLVAVFGQRLTAPRHKRAADGTVESNAFLLGKLRNAETLHALGMLGHLRRMWFDIHERVLMRQAEANEGALRLQALTKYLQYAQQSMMLALGALLAIDGEISAGAMIASNALMSNALRPIGLLVSTWRPFVEARQSYARLAALLDAHPERDAAHAAAEVRGEVATVGLVATAPGRAQPILNGLDLEFRRGEVVGVVGPSGAGKSTLARCLVGIWPWAQGEVRLDGQPLGRWSREALGPHLGYLPQDVELFDGTIAENIARFGEVEPPKVIEAAQRTGIHEMVLRFPKGYDTPIGEAGSLLSGGQRQRIGLARAIYGEPALIVLDEPNANLDDVGEAALVRTVRELRERGRTVVMIVHQRHVLAAADRVLVLEQGAVKSFGPLAAPAPAPRIEMQP